MGAQAADSDPFFAEIRQLEEKAEGMRNCVCLLNVQPAQQRLLASARRPILSFASRLHGQLPDAIQGLKGFVPCLFANNHVQVGC
jgi:hypothetical protein